MLFINANLDQDLGRVATLPDGSETAPSLSFVNDDDTGLFRRSLNTLSVSAGNAERMHIDSDGITVYGNVTTGTTVVGDHGVITTSLDTASVASNLVPNGNGLLDLGSASNRWGDLYLSGNSIYLGNAVVSESGGDVAVSGSITATTFAGNGSTLTSLDASHLASGTVPDARVSGAYTGITDLTASGNVSAGNVSVTNDAIVHGHTVGRGGGGVSTNVAMGDGALASNTTGSSNTASGVDALRDNTTGTNNTASGQAALQNNTTGTQNTAIGTESHFNANVATNCVAVGYQSLYSNSDGNDNVAVGVESLKNNTTGSNNTASGFQALYLNTTGSNNTASGHVALYSNTTGSYNTASGVDALRSNTTGSQNTAVGKDAHYNANIATSCVAVGYQSLYSNSDGNDNVAVGVESLKTNTTGSQNTAVGRSALQNNTTGSYNTASGVSALHRNTTGSFNTASGVNALFLNTTGSFNTASGVNALNRNTTGSYNTASGQAALYYNTTGSQNTASGHAALFFNTTGSYNTASGRYALYSNTTGSYNTASGRYALYSNTTGSNNTASGLQSLYYNTTGSNNTASGAYALFSNTTGSLNTASGVAALERNTTGSLNTASGVDALRSNTTGSENTASGVNALRYTTSGGAFNYSNCSGLGYDSRANGNNEVSLGNTNTTVYTQSGTVVPRSDARDKTDIRDETFGLDFLLKIRPRMFKWDHRERYQDRGPGVSGVSLTPADGTYTIQTNDQANIGTLEIRDGRIHRLVNTISYDTIEDVPTTVTVVPEAGGDSINVTADTSEDALIEVPKDGSRAGTRYHHGVIAQEFKAMIDELGIDFSALKHHAHNGGEDVYSFGYGELITPMIKAIQELKAMNDTLEARVSTLENT